MNLKHTLHIVASELFRAYEDVIEGDEVEAVNRLRLIQQDLANFLGSTNIGPMQFDLEPFMSPDKPEGYATVLGYIAMHHRDQLDMMDDFALDTMSLGVKAARLCKQKGIAPIKVKAPKVLQEDIEIDVVNAYPIEILKEVIN